MTATHPGMIRLLERLKAATAVLFIENGQELPWFGSGVLVVLAGKEFVLTAGHNVWDAERRALTRIAVTVPSPSLVALIGPGDGSAGRVWVNPPAQGDPEPDVAVVELTEKTWLRTDRRPFEADEIAFFDDGRTTRHPDVEHPVGINLAMAGIPAQVTEHTREQPTQGAFKFTVLTGSVWSRPRTPRAARTPTEPSDGRLIHLFVSERAELSDGSPLELPPAPGMSGGAIAEPVEGGDGLLVGLLRGVIRDDGWRDQTGEPVAEAIRLLEKHSDPSVASAAREIVARYDEFRRANRSG